MKAIFYRIKLLEPSLVTALDGDPNSAVALTYLPGSVLRGALIKSYLRQHGVGTSLADNAALRRLFFDGSTRFLNGYPVENDQRTLPTPLSWHTLKERKWPIRDFAVSPQPFNPKEQWQGLKTPFCLLTERSESREADEDDEESEPTTEYYRDQIRLCSPEKLLQVHTNRERQSGRPRADAGAVYRYESLAADQIFEAAILWEQETDTTEGNRQFDDFCSLLGGEIRLGGARSAGYGRVKFEDGIRIVDDWSEVPPGRAEKVSGKLVVTLLSDALLRDGNGQFSTDWQAVKAACEQVLGVAPNSPDKPPEVYARTTIIGGFNRKWGLPLPQTAAIKMGSVYVFDDPHCEAGKLTEFERNGIGERRSEGFGRIAVNWLRSEELNEASEPERKPYEEVTIPAGTADALAKTMVKRMLRQKLDAIVLGKAGDVTVSEPPNNSQLSRLREVIREGLMSVPSSIEPVNNHLKDVRQRRAALNQYERANVGGRRFLMWLEGQINLTSQPAWENEFWRHSEKLPKLGSITAEITDSLRREYLLRYIDAVVVRAIKQSREDSDEPQQEESSNG